jgi:hypothetical protein
VKRLAIGLTPTLLLFAVGCAHGPLVPAGGGAATGRLAHLRRDGIAFSYPAAWSHHRRGFQSTMTDGFVDLSTQPMVNPCRTRGTKTTCGWPIRHLRSGGVVVDWSTGGMLLEPGRLGPVGVRVRVLHDPYCRRVGGNRALSAQVVLRGHRSYLAYACLRAPNVARNDVAFRAMVASARPASP